MQRVERFQHVHDHELDRAPMGRIGHPVVREEGRLQVRAVRSNTRSADADPYEVETAERGVTMAVAGMARTLDLAGKPTVGSVVGLYPRPVGVCTVDHTPSMEPAVFAERYGTASVDSVRLIAGVGMEGDRYAKGISAFSGAKRSSQLTLVAQEDVDAVERDYGVRIEA